MSGSLGGTKPVPSLRPLPVTKTWTKRRKNRSTVDEELTLSEGSPLFDFFAYIFKQAQGVKPNPLPGVPSTEKSPTSAVLPSMSSRASKNGKTEQT
ncbi:hypothetical protein BGZ90_001133 [Linnemannia elongata]|nr:hypothetical protein BGZ90_001133 [Linnemannia elongata]